MVCIVTKDDVVKALKQVLDPEIGINVVDLGLIYDVQVDNQDVNVKMTLTTPYCPMHSMFTQDVERAIKSTGVANVKVELTFDPPWTPEKMSEEAKATLGL